MGSEMEEKRKEHFLEGGKEKQEKERKSGKLRIVRY